MIEVWQFTIRFKKFSGVRAGHSIWKEVDYVSPCFSSQLACSKTMCFFRDHVLPCTGVKIMGYFIEAHYEYEKPEEFQCNLPF